MDNKIITFEFKTSSTYFYGHEFSEFLASQAFSRLEHYLGHGLCYESAAMLMLDLKDNQSAKIVHGYALSDRGRRGHAWVEFSKDGQDWAVSPNWLDNIAVRKDVFYGEKLGFFPEPVWVCPYKKFWNQPVSKTLYGLVKKSDTSFDILPMLQYYRPDDCDHPVEFGFEHKMTHRIRSWMASDEMKKCPITYCKLITAQIVDEVAVQGRSFPSLEAQIEAYEILSKFQHLHCHDKTAV